MKLVKYPNVEKFGNVAELLYARETFSRERELFPSVSLEIHAGKRARHAYVLIAFTHMRNADPINLAYPARSTVAAVYTFAARYSRDIRETIVRRLRVR